MSFGFVHNRLLTRMVLDQATFAGLQALIRRDAARARRRGYDTMPALGAPFTRVTRPAAGSVDVDSAAGRGEPPGLDAPGLRRRQAKPAPHMQAKTHTSVEPASNGLQWRDERGDDPDDAGHDAAADATR